MLESLKNNTATLAGTVMTIAHINGQRWLKEQVTFYYGVTTVRLCLIVE